MNEKDIERMLSESELDMSHINKDDILAKAKQEIYFGDTVTASEPQKETRSLPLFFAKKRFVAAAAGVALAFTLCAGMVGLYNEDFQTLYIDINPSVALKLNRFERVIGVEFLNEEAKALLADTKLVGCDAENALKTVISACDSAGYVNQEGEIYISAASKEEKTSEKLLQKLKGTAEKIKPEDNETYSVSTYNAKEEEKEEIKKSDISPAKYKIIKDIVDEDERYRMEDLKNKPMHELKDLRDRIDDDDDDDDDRYDREDHENPPPKNDRENNENGDEDDDDRDKEHDSSNRDEERSAPPEKEEHKNYHKDED